MATLHPLRKAVMLAKAKREFTADDFQAVMMWLALVHQADVWSVSMKAPDLPAVKQAANRVIGSCRDFNVLWEKHLKGKEGFDHDDFWDFTAQLSDVTKAFTRDPKRMHSMATKIIKETTKEAQ